MMTSPIESFLIVCYSNEVVCAFASHFYCVFDKKNVLYVDETVNTDPYSRYCVRVRFSHGYFSENVGVDLIYEEYNCKVRLR
jgi:hypothetical protein